MSSCKNKKPCGCSDAPLTTPGPCTATGPCAGEPCAELFCNECIVQCQPDIFVTVDAYEFLIPQGMRLDSILQKMLLFMADPTCVDTYILGFQFVAKTTTTLTIRWQGAAGTTYVVTWVEGMNTYASLPLTGVDGVNQYQIINLIPDTKYNVTISDDDTGCTSVTMILQTNPNPVV